MKVFEYTEAKGVLNSIPRSVLKNINEIEEEFGFYLSRMQSDYWDVFQLLSSEGKVALQAKLVKDCKELNGLQQRDQIIERLKRANEFKTFIHLERTGEIRKSEDKRPAKERVNLGNKRQVEHFIEYITFQNRRFIQSLEGIATQSSPTLGSFFDFGMNDVITEGHIDRFLSICKYYCDPHDFDEEGEQITIITYDQENDKFHFNGIGRSQIPPLGQFLRALAPTGILSPACGTYQIAAALLRFFHVSSKDGIKYLSKESRKPNKKFEKYFKHIKNL